MRHDPRAVTGTVLLGLLVGAAALARPDPAPVAERVLRIDGAVARPGWYEADALGPAVAAAGGGVSHAAQPFADGDHVRVFAGWALSPDAPPPVETDAFTPGKLRLNHASLADLEALPHVGPVLARRIVEGRPYRSLADLDRVKGIGAKTLAKLRPLVAP
jgi:DNA uptake protein ComE-like DNA-binding protein